MQNLFIVFGFLSLGFFISRYLFTVNQLPQRLNKFIINVSFPAVILLTAPAISFQYDALFSATAPWMIILIVAVSTTLITKQLGWSKEIRTVILLLAALGNTGFVGIPLAKAFFSTEQLGHAIMYDQMGSFLAFITYGTFVISKQLSDNSGVRWQNVIKRVITFPPFLSFIIAMLIPQDIYPEILLTSLHYLALTIIPLAMLSIGMTLQFHVDTEYRVPLMIGLSFKLVLAPVLILVSGLVLGKTPDLIEICIFQAALPPSVACSILLLNENILPKFVRSFMAISTLASIISVPIIMYCMSSLLAIWA